MRPFISCQSCGRHNADGHKCFGAAPSTSQLRCIVIAQHTHRAPHRTDVHIEHGHVVGTRTQNRVHRRNKNLSRAIKAAAVGSTCHRRRRRRYASVELSNYPKTKMLRTRKWLLVNSKHTQRGKFRLTFFFFIRFDGIAQRSRGWHFTAGCRADWCLPYTRSAWTRMDF